MGMVKKLSTAVEGTASLGSAVVQPEVKKPESGIDAAVARLQTPKAPEDVKLNIKKEWLAPKARDFDKEARGKTRCVQFEAALMSPALAGLKFSNIDEYLELVKKAADAGVAYTFGE